MLPAFRLARLSALEPHYAGEFALTQTEPSVAPPSVKNIDGDKRHDESDQGGGDDDLSLSNHSTHGIAGFRAHVASGYSLGLL